MRGLGDCGKNRGERAYGMLRFSKDPLRDFESAMEIEENVAFNRDCMSSKSHRY